MKFSIITVVLNNVQTIGHALKSVVEQDYPELEYIVIDGGSTDGTLEVIESVKASYPGRISKVLVGKDNGIYDAMNKGLYYCTGDVIGILNSDDFYAHNQVLTRVATQMQKSGASTCYADLQYVDRLDTNKILRHWRSGSYKKSNFDFGWMPPHPTFFVSRVLYQEFGLFNLSFHSAADYELMLRLLYKYNCSACYLPEVIVKMRVGGLSNQSLEHRIYANQEDRRAWEENGLKPKFYTIPLKPLRKLPQFILGRLGLAGKL